MSRVRDVRDYDSVMAMREHTGFGGLKISKRTGIPASTVDGWIHNYAGYGSPRTRKQRWEDFGAQPLPATRRCTKCRETKDKKHFYIQFRGATGNAYLSSWCKKCLRGKADAQRKTDPEAHRRRSREAHRSRRAAKVKTPRINAEPLIRYLEPWGIEALHVMLSASQKQAHRRAIKSGVISHKVASDILTAIDRPGVMRQLYGEA